MNAMGGYARFKKKGEEALRESDINFTIVRPTWLADDETKLKYTEVGVGDEFSVMKTKINRSQVGEVCVQALMNDEETRGITFECVGREEGSKDVNSDMTIGVDSKEQDWGDLFSKMKN